MDNKEKGLEAFEGISLEKIEFDEYGRSVTKDPKYAIFNSKSKTFYASAEENFVQDKWCPPEDPDQPAVLMEQQDEWKTEKRYFQMESI